MVQKDNYQKNKILIIGIDGGTLDIILPMIKKNKLPTFEKLIKNGSYGKLLSTVPPVTAPAWTSFITGTNPGRHGIFYFFNKDDENSKKRIVSFNNIKTKPFWRNLNDNGFKVGLVNIPITYPPDRVDGFIISGMLVPPEATDYVYPNSLFSKLKEYKVDLDGLMEQNEWRAGTLVKRNRDEFIKNVFRLTQSRAENTLKLMKEMEWDFFMVVFTGSDRISHFFWEDPSGRNEFSTIIEDYYTMLDTLIARLIKETGEETIKLLMSDHGFGSSPKRILNLYVLSKLFQLNLTSLKFWKKYLTNRILSKIIKNEKLDSIEFLENDKNIISYHPIYANFFGIGFNNKAENHTEKNLLIEIKNRITEKLLEIKDPKTGKKLVQQVFPRETIYSGPLTDSAPDLIVQLDYDYIVKFHPARRKLTYDIRDRKKTGEHRVEGLLIANGPHIIKKKLNSNISIQDVTPTILYLMNCPIPRRYDGRLIEELFSKYYIKQNKPIYEEDGFNEFLQNDETEIDDFEESKKLLENLGYL
jgi:predicted AlkP superfamily phosphohydrolase/phosphomutase